ncbi:MAG: hypothetical protein Kow0032_27720 [Methyloligellaceae bacterium]
MENLNELVARIYDCALDLSRWPGILQAIAARQRIDLVHILAVDRLQETPLFSVSNLGEPLVASGKSARQSGPSAALVRAAVATRAGAVRFEQLPDLKKEAGCALSDHIGQAALGRYAVTGLLETDRLKACLFMHACEPHKQFAERVYASLSELQPHLARSLALANRIETLKFKSHTAWDLVARLQTGVIIIDPEQMILHINKEAKRIIAQKDGLARRGKRLVTTQRPGTPGLMELLRSNLAPADGANGREARAMFSIARPSGRRPLVIHAREIPNDPFTMPAETPVFCLLIRDLEAQRLSKLTAFSHAFKLTPAEERLILALISDGSLKSHARDEEISEETARWHLKNIFSKTDCRSQVGLVNLVHASAIQDDGTAEKQPRTTCRRTASRKRPFLPYGIGRFSENGT